MDLITLLAEAIQAGASDLHISRDVPPTIRVDGELRFLEYPPLNSAQCLKLLYSVLNDEQRAKFERDWELDFSLEIERAGRFRANVHRQRGTVEGAFRIVQDEIRSVNQLGLPPKVSEFAARDSGLIIITGPTGSGKTTTMAAMIDQINRERRCVVVTIEDPVEYVHRPKSSIIKQREVYLDTRTFANALRHALRQDPDVICIGEMRDLETISTVLTAAETGHLVIATLHTPDAVQTVDRIVDVFPPHQQQQVRIQLANTLQGIVAQQLLPVAGTKGRVPAVEVLAVTIAARKIIRSAKTEQLTTLIQTSYDQGMITMDKSLKELYMKGLITYDAAISKCKYPEAFESI